MAIGTDAAIEFFGTQTDLDSTSGTVADAAFSVAGDLTTFTQTSAQDVPQASVILEATFSVAPDANSSVALFAQLIDIEGTNDAPVPTANYQSVFLGSFPVKDVTSIERYPIIISLPNNNATQIYQFFIQNNAGQTISAGWTIFITPKTIGPKA